MTHSEQQSWLIVVAVVVSFIALVALICLIAVALKLYLACMKERRSNRYSTIIHDPAEKQAFIKMPALLNRSKYSFVYLMCMLAVASGNIVQTTYKARGGHLYDVNSVINLPIYPGSVQKFNLKPSELAELVPASVRLVGLTCQYSVLLDYWFSDYQWEEEKTYECCGSVDCNDESTDGCYAKGYRYENVFPCLWTKAHCFCCNDGNSACYKIKEYPKGTFRPDEVAYAVRVVSSTPIATIQFKFGAVDRIVNVTDIGEGFVRVGGSSLKVSGQVGTKCLANGKYVIYHQGLYRIDFPAFRASAPSSIGDVASREYPVKMQACNYVYYTSGHVTAEKPWADSGSFHWPYTIKNSGFHTMKKQISDGQFENVLVSQANGCHHSVQTNRLDVVLTSKGCRGNFIVVELKTPAFRFHEIEKMPNVELTNVVFSNATCHSCGFVMDVSMTYTSDAVGIVPLICTGAVCSESAIVVSVGKGEVVVKAAPSSVYTELCINLQSSQKCGLVHADDPITYHTTNRNESQGGTGESGDWNIFSKIKTLAKFFPNLFGGIFGTIVTILLLCGLVVLAYVIFARRSGHRDPIYVPLNTTEQSNDDNKVKA